MEENNGDLINIPRSTHQAKLPLLHINQHCIKELNPLSGKFCTSLQTGTFNINHLISFQKTDEGSEDKLIPRHFYFDNERLEYEHVIDDRQIGIYLQRLRMNVQKLEIAARKNLQNAEEYLKVRKNQGYLFRAITSILEYVSVELVRKHVNQIRPLWRPVILTSNWRELFASSYDGSGEYIDGCYVTNSARFHYVHGCLEAHWWFIEYLLRRDIVNLNEGKGKLVLANTELEAEYKLWLLDIICLCILQFSKAINEKITVFDLLQSNAVFNCICQLESLIACALLADKLHQQHCFGTFSDYFLEIMSVFQDDKLVEHVQNLCDFLPSKNIFKRLPAETNFPKVKPELLNFFTIICLVRIAQVEFIDEKPIIEALQSSLNIFFKADPSEDKLRAVLILMSDLLIQKWESKCDIISLFFDCIYKRVNSPFFMPNSRLDTLAIVDSEPRAFLEEVKQTLLNVKTISQNSTSFSMLVYIIGNQLKKLKSTGQRHLSNKILGRIFSKFNISKIISLSERGLHNFIGLIVTLACSSDLSDFGNRLIDILFQIQYNKLLPERQKILAKGHLAMLLLYAEEEIDFGRHIEKLLVQMKEHIGDHTCLWSLLALAIEEIIDKRHCFDHGAKFLIGSWIHPFMNICGEKEKTEFLQTISNILKYLAEKQSTDQCYLAPEKELLMKTINKSMFSYVLPMVRQQFLKTRDIICIPQISARFTSLANGNDGIPNFEMLLNFFGNVLRPNVQYGIIYYTNLFEMNLQKIPAHIMMQNWIKFELLMQNISEEQLALMRTRTFNIPEVRQKIGVESHEIILKQSYGGAAPLIYFKFVFGIYYKLENYKEKMEYVASIEKYLTNFVGWAQSHIETTNIYRFTSSLLKYCAPMLYSKMNHSCIFNQIFQHMILTPDILVGKQPTPNFCKNMTLSFADICTTLAKMNYKQDSYIMDKFNNLIIKWTPLLSKADKEMSFVCKAYISLIRVTEPDVIEATLKVFASHFIQPKGLLAATAYIGSTIYKTVYLEVVKLNESKITAVLNGTLEAMFEQVAQFDEAAMSKRILVDILKDILSPSRMNEHHCIEIAVLNALKSITDLKIVHYKTSYFGLMQKLSRMNPNIIQKFLPHIKETVYEIENVLGVANSSGLRESYLNLEKTINALKR